MSERRAKRERKEFEASKVVVKKKDHSKVISNLIIVVVIAAVAGLGVFATWDSIVTVFERPSDVVSEQQPARTVAMVAEEKGTTAEELLAKCGLAESGLTAESTEDELYSKFTIESYAKFEDKTVEDLKAENGIEDLANDTLWMDATMKIPMGVVAEQSGATFEEFATQNGLPSEITAETTYEEALSIMQEQMAAQQAQEAPQEPTDDAQAAENE